MTLSLALLDLALFSISSSVGAILAIILYLGSYSSGRIGKSLNSFGTVLTSLNIFLHNLYQKFMKYVYYRFINN